MADTTFTGSAPLQQGPEVSGGGNPAATDHVPIKKEAVVKEEEDAPSVPDTSEAPSTPGKKASKSKKPAIPKTPKEPGTPKAKVTPAKRAADGEATPKSVKKIRVAPANDRKTIPTSAELLSEEDKMLLKWKEEGKPWSAINAEWGRITGSKPGNSTLPNRYVRVKAAISVVADSDVPQMLASIQAIDAAIEAEHKDAVAKKWTRIAKHMKDNGVEMEYAAATVEKQFKKIKDGAPDVNTSTPPRIDSSVESSDEAGTKAAAKAVAKAEHAIEIEASKQAVSGDM